MKSSKRFIAGEIRNTFKVLLSADFCPIQREDNQAKLTLPY